ncbi:hypothetical protein MANES_07G074129v8, partial [Manihot esculenta]
VVASLEIPTLLLSGGRTRNSIFKIPIDINENFTCDIKKGTQFTSLINKTSLVIWDKSPMNHGYYFKAVDRTLRDILTNDSSMQVQTFGSKTILLGSNFKQILHVVMNNSKEEILNASLIKLKNKYSNNILRNLNPGLSLCNRTTLIITDHEKHVIATIIIIGSLVGNKVYIPRI